MSFDELVDSSMELYERGVLVLSKYRLMSHDFCPQQYKVSMMDNVPREPSVYMNQGTAFHKCVGTFYDNINMTELMRCNLYKDIVQIMLKAVTSYKVSSTIQEWLVNFATQEATRFWTYCRETNDPIRYFIPLTRESMYETESMRIKGIDVKFKGVIDRIDVLPNGKVLLLDYKRNIRDLTVFRKEMAYYWRLYEGARLNPYIASHVGGYGCLTDQWYVMELTDRTFYALDRAVDRFINSTKSGVYEPRIGDWCVNCEVAGYCEAWKV